MDAAVVTGATAVATGILGYLGARLQHGGEEARLDIERDRLRLDQTRAESERAVLAAQRLDEQLERRRLLYYDVLDTAENAWSLCVRHEPVHESDLDLWWVAYQRVRRQVRIGSASDVVEAFLDVNDALVHLFDHLLGVIRVTGAEDASKARISVWNEEKAALEPAMRELESAMRADLDVAD
jgi:hypothetical protein